MSKQAKKVIVTGGAGFIGSHIVDELIKQKYQVIVIDNLSSGKKEFVNPKAEFHKIDVCDFKKIKPLFKNVEYVFHLAAQPRIQPSIVDPSFSFKNNIMGSMNVLLASKESGVKKVIYAASSSVYGDQDILPLKEEATTKPKSPYSLSKLVGEHLCRIFSDLYGLDTVCLRYFNVYGPRQTTNGAYATVIGIFLEKLRNGQPLPIFGNGFLKRDFTYIDDVVRANFLAMNSEKRFNGEIINIGTGKNYSINEVAQMVISNIKPKIVLSGANGFIEHLPPRLGESKEVLADNKKAFKLLGWKPSIGLDQGIRSLLKD